jgi:hypothetical protein
VQLPHWRGFSSAGELERHLKDNLPKAQQDNGGLRHILNDWKLQDRYRRMREQSSDKPVSLEQMFERQIQRQTKNLGGNDG